ncbi:MAG: NUDIX hydrolase [Gammaproteobacteria bacterium]|nr:MAG: NUDIX hydrolase [Gammaproteobacteria bacterium]
MSTRDNPWKTLSVKDIYDNPWLQVAEHQVINPAGKPGIYGLVKFKNCAVGIIPIDDHGYTWIVGQYRYALDAYSWEIPMGGVPVGTDMLAGARRELKEETGLTAANWREILSVHISNSVTDETGFVFVAEGLTPGKPEFEETEKIDIRRLPFDELVEMAMTGEITDGLSVTGILKLARLHAGS